MNLNLVYLEKSELKYKINNYPDGQSDLQITIPPNHWDYVNVTIISRFNSFKDLELILCVTKALRNMGTMHIHLYVPYILGARSDRKFVDGGVRYLKDIIAPIINAQNYTSVQVLDPHSDVMENVIDRLKIVTNVNLVKSALVKIVGNTVRGGGLQEEFIIVSPDAGALKKIYNVAQAINYNDEIIVASKHRDISTGKILSTEIPKIIQHMAKDFVIIDDICDGGRTFIEIAKKIKAELPGDHCGKIFLIVTHGIFSAGFGELSQYFDDIYCTNSVKDFEFQSSTYGSNIHQINVF